MLNTYSGLARHSDPHTSKTAADSVEPQKVIDEIYAVMKIFGEAGCITDDVQGLLLHRSLNTITPRFKQMIELGMIEVVEDVTKTGKSGRPQLVRRILPPPFTPTGAGRLTYKKPYRELLKENDHLKAENARLHQQIQGMTGRRSV